MPSKKSSARTNTGAAHLPTGETDAAASRCEKKRRFTTKELRPARTPSSSSTRKVESTRGGVSSGWSRSLFVASAGRTRSEARRCGRGGTWVELRQGYAPSSSESPTMPVVTGAANSACDRVCAAKMLCGSAACPAATTIHNKGCCGSGSDVRPPGAQVPWPLITCQ